MCPCHTRSQVENAAIGLPSIEPETLAEALTGRHDWPVDRLLLVDCRYEYEHVGGCVLGALNMQVCLPDLLFHFLAGVYFAIRSEF